MFTLHFGCLWRVPKVSQRHNWNFHLPKTKRRTHTHTHVPHRLRILLFLCCFRVQNNKLSSHERNIFAFTAAVNVGLKPELATAVPFHSLALKQFGWDSAHTHIRRAKETAIQHRHSTQSCRSHLWYTRMTAMERKWQSEDRETRTMANNFVSHFALDLFETLDFVSIAQFAKCEWVCECLIEWCPTFRCMRLGTFFLRRTYTDACDYRHVTLTVHKRTSYIDIHIHTLIIWISNNDNNGKGQSHSLSTLGVCDVGEQFSNGHASQLKSTFLSLSASI